MGVVLFRLPQSIQSVANIVFFAGALTVVLYIIAEKKKRHETINYKGAYFVVLAGLILYFLHPFIRQYIY
ncbi:MAG: hypothetical protein EAZ47_08640 [Bacteroidetes bacterium]|nr:MAG: hypothetical protein EAY72_07365 [Bacteroidota bacterium]TAE67749.1 MAG: hypothetical protein EAY68_05055 [Bacteroidota bacterium]TAF92544.1 MAG: hypothetical protein EAZ47_08640 [Bacteroidota bacterium]